MSIILKKYASVLGVGGFATVYNLGTFARKAFATSKEHACLKEWAHCQSIRDAMQTIERRAVAEKNISMVELAFIRGGYQKLMIAFRESTDITPVGSHSLDFIIAECDLAHAAFTYTNDGTMRAPVHCPRFASTQSVLKVVTDCLGGLVFLHEHARMIHNDIKPTNLLLCRDGVKIADFGIAQSWISQTSSVYSDDEKQMILVGSIAYQAPEIWLQDMFGNGKIDVFALGLSLYEVFEGVRLITIPPDITSKYNDWLNAKSNVHERQEAFVTAMRVWHSNAHNHQKFARLAVGDNLPAYSHMHELVPAAIRRMLIADAKGRPTARQLCEMLQVMEQRSTKTVDASTDTSDIPPAPEPPSQLSLLDVAMTGLGPTALLAEAAAALADVDVDRGGNADVAVAGPSGATQPKSSLMQVLSEKYKLATNERDVEAATVLVGLAAQRPAAHGCNNMNKEKDRLVVRLKRKAQSNSSVSSTYKRALKIFKALQSADTQYELTYEERLVLAIVLERPVECSVGSTNPQRTMFQTLTQRTANWWKKHRKGNSMNFSNTKS
jgi:serine/threonine protein kinase